MVIIYLAKVVFDIGIEWFTDPCLYTILVMQQELVSTTSMELIYFNIDASCNPTIIDSY